MNQTEAPASMKVTIFDFLIVLSFAMPLGCGVAEGLKGGSPGTLVGLTLGLVAGAGSFLGIRSTVEYGGKRALRLAAGPVQELVLLLLLVGGFICVFAASFLTMYITTLLVRHFAA